MCFNEEIFNVETYIIHFSYLYIIFIHEYFNFLIFFIVIDIIKL